MQMGVDGAYRRGTAVDDAEHGALRRAADVLQEGLQHHDVAVARGHVNAKARVKGGNVRRGQDLVGFLPVVLLAAAFVRVLLFPGAAAAPHGAEVIPKEKHANQARQKVKVDVCLDPGRGPTDRKWNTANGWMDGEYNG